MSASKRTNEQVIIQKTETTHVLGQHGTKGEQGDPGASAMNSVSLGPWVEAGVLGFVNQSGSVVQISDETTVGTGTVSEIAINGSTVSLPQSLENGDLLEVEVSGVSGRFYWAAKIQEV